MAVFRLEFDVDSDVHPELHAMLSAIADPAHRAERLRQLAAAGLIWETVRLHGYPKAFDMPPARPMPAPVPARSAAPAPPARAPASTAAVPAPSSAPAAPARRGRATPRPDFIDLAIDAGPAAAPWDGVERRGGPPESLPVLVDVVEADAGKPARSRSRRTARTRATDVPTLGEDSVLEVTGPATAPAPLAEAAEASPRATLHELEVSHVVPAHSPNAAGAAVDPPVSGFDPLEDIPVVAPLAQRPETKSRLMRMKERGLFRNG